MGIEMEKQAYETKKTEKPIWDSDETEVNLKSVSNGVEIPQDLICPVCKDLLKVCKVILKKREGGSNYDIITILRKPPISLNL